MGALAGKRVVTKSRCCRDRPRCKKCPVAWKRLESAGLATREDRRVFHGGPELKKKQLAAARGK